MTTKELIAKSDAELKKELQRLTLEAKDLAMKKKMGQLKQVHKLSPIRKDIARIHTILHAR